MSTDFENFYGTSMPIPLAELEEVLAQPRASESFSGVVSLRQGDTVLFEAAYGDAIRSESIPNRVDTRFQIASGCKIFTSVAINQLFEQGRLAPDTLLRDCVGVPLPHFAPDITVQQLLTHTAGVPDYFDEAVTDDYEALWRQVPMYTIRRPADFLPLFQDKPMQAPPGSTFVYNNGGYVLLGLIVEQITGTPFAEYIAQQIFRPAGMADSGYFASNQLPPHTAYSYIENGDGTWRNNIYAVPIVGGPDGGAYTTAADMARFWQSLQAYTLLNAETTARLLWPYAETGSPPPYDHYGRGVWIEAGVAGIRKYFVEGSDPGVAFRSAIYPAQGLTLTILANTGRTLWPLFREIEALVAPLDGRGAPAGANTPARDRLPPVAAPHVARLPNPLTEQELRDFLARYSPWSLVETPDEHAVDGVRRELHRAYEFPSYQAAFHFMNEVSARAVERLSHHPRWQNTWTQVEVWLTTYNLGCRPSIKDLKLAESCEQVWREIRRSHVW